MSKKKERKKKLFVPPSKEEPLIPAPTVSPYLRISPGKETGPPEFSRLQDEYQVLQVDLLEIPCLTLVEVRSTTFSMFLISPVLTRCDHTDPFCIMSCIQHRWFTSHFLMWGYLKPIVLLYYFC